MHTHIFAQTTEAKAEFHEGKNGGNFTVLPDPVPANKTNFVCIKRYK